LQQHDRHFDTRKRLWNHYEANEDIGPDGFLEPFSLLGAARLSSTIDALESESALGGQIWHIDMITGEIAISKVIGVDSCPSCGLHRSPANRSVLEIRAALSYLWP
jgi:hypothetical protein